MRPRTRRAILRRVRRHLAPLLASALLVACGEDEPVPFGLDRPHAESTPTPAETTTDEVAAPVSLTAAVWPEGTRELDVGGGHVLLTSDVARASAVLDLDGDADLDLFLVAVGDDGTPRLLHLRRDGETFGEPAVLSSFGALASGCVATSARIEALGPSFVGASLETECANTNGPAARATHAWVVDVSATPRLLERFSLGRGDDADGFELLEVDRDDDGHDDLIVQLRVGTETVSLAWRSAASGLARDTTEPETRIGELADAAREAVRRSPETAVATARAALALHAAICRETETARFEVGVHAGLSCGASAGAGRARAMLAAAIARQGDVLGAMELVAALDRPDVTVRDVDRNLATAELGGVGGTSGWTMHDGPEAAASGTAEAPRLSSLAFDDETHLLVRTGEPRVIDLATSIAVPAPDRGERRLLDPSHALELVAIERRCEGTVIVIAPESGIVNPITGDRRTALVEPRAAPTGAPCPDLTDVLRRDAHGFFALGWAPQGVLVARGSELVVVPLDVGGHPAGAVETLTPESLAPAPIEAGHATRDVSAFARSTPHGILLVTRSPAAAVLIRPEGYEHEGASIDVAVSPSARRIAWIGAGRLHWADAP